MNACDLRVCIPSFERVSDGKVVYKVRVWLKRLNYEVWRRFSDFVALHEQLLASDYAALPLLPPKTLLPNVTDKVFLEERRCKLINYLHELLRRPDTRMSEELLTFLSLTDQAAVHSKSIRPVMVGTTGPQRFAVSSLAQGPSCIIAAYEDKTSMSRLGRLWTLVEPDELGQLSVWFLDSSTKVFSASYSEKLSCKGRVVMYHAESNRVILGLDDGTLQCLQLDDSGNLQKELSAAIHQSPVVGLSGQHQILSAAADGSIRLLEAKTLKILSGGRSEKRLGLHSITCCCLDAATLTAYLGTTAGVLLLYSLSSKTPTFLKDIRFASEEPISVILKQEEVYVGLGGDVCILTFAGEEATNKRVCSAAETLNSLVLQTPENRFFAGYQSYICLWCMDTLQCLLSWRAHTGGVYQLLLSESGDCLISGGDSGTIKVWQLPPSSSLTPWSVQAAPQENEEAEQAAATAFAADPQQHQQQVSWQQQQQQQHQQVYQQQQQQQPFAASLPERQTFALLRRCSSDSEDDAYTPPQQQQQQQQQQREPPLLQQQQAEDSSDEDLDDLRSALA